MRTVTGWAWTCRMGGRSPQASTHVRQNPLTDFGFALDNPRLSPILRL